MRVPWGKTSVPRSTFIDTVMTRCHISFDFISKYIYFHVYADYLSLKFILEALVLWLSFFYTYTHSIYYTDKYNVCVVGVFSSSNSTEYDEVINYKS